MSAPRNVSTLDVGSWRQDVSFFDRHAEGPALLFVHGLGNAAANFDDLVDEPALAGHRLVALDFPGCGASPYPADRSLRIDDLADLLEAFVAGVGLSRFLIVGASMGGLTSLLYAERHPERLLGFVNVEGNLAPEDCMFSRLVVPHDREHFERVVFPEIKATLGRRPGRGFREHLRVLAQADPRAFYDYSFQLVEDSDHGKLLDRFVALPTPRHFVYGSANRGLSYLPRLRNSECTVTEIADADHFLFYDNPEALAASLAQAAPISVA